jgi:hypothetical protein
MPTLTAMARQRRPTPSELRDDQLQRASRLRTSLATGATALAIAIGWFAASTLPGRAASAQSQSATQDSGASLSANSGTGQGLQPPAQAPSNNNGSGSGGGGGGFVINSGGS